MSLSKYKKKRNFSISPEPTAIVKKKKGELSFVVSEATQSNTFAL